jgi:hypothetical protein
VDAEAVEGPDAVPGVRELRQLGFEPVEEHTGALWVAEVWPDRHRRFVSETREFWLRAEPELSGRLWLVRSPWPGWTVSDTFDAMWRWLERPEIAYDADYLLPGVCDFLRWAEFEAARWRVEPPGDHG